MPCAFMVVQMMLVLHSRGWIMFPANEWWQVLGSEMKHTLMLYIHDNAEKVGQLLGGSPQVAAAIWCVDQSD